MMMSDQKQCENADLSETSQIMYYSKGLVLSKNVSFIKFE